MNGEKINLSFQDGESRPVPFPTAQQVTYQVVLHTVLAKRQAGKLRILIFKCLV